MHPKSPLDCRACERSQSCCRNVGLFPIPVLPEEVEDFGQDNVEEFVGADEEEHEDLFVVLPGPRGHCPHLRKDGGCGLGSKRPSFCKSYPLLYDGDLWYLDAGCPKAASVTFTAALSEDSEEFSFLARAVRLLYFTVGDRHRAVIERRVSGWRFPLVIGEIPKKLLRRRRTRK